MRILLGFVTPRWGAPLLVALGLLASLAEGVSIGLLIPFFNALLYDDVVTDAAGPLVTAMQRYAAFADGDARIALVGGTIVVLIVLKSVIVYANSALWAWISTRVAHRLRLAVFQQLLGVGYAFVARKDPGELVNSLEVETWRATEALDTLFSMAIHLCTVIVFTCLLLMISWQLTLGVAFGVATASFIVQRITRRAHEIGRTAVSTNQTLSERAVEAIYGMRIIRAFCQEAREGQRYDEASDKVRHAYFRIALVKNVVRPLLEVLYLPIFFGALLLAWAIGIGVPTLLAFLVLLYRMQPYVKALDHHRVTLATLGGAVSDIAELLETRDKPYVVSGSHPFLGLKQEVRFRDVEFRYRDENSGDPVLAGVTFNIPCGRTTAIVGESGAGKSTLINLLFRFYDPNKGDILIDGVPLRELDLTMWRQRIALAGQDIDLLNGTVRDNIAYGMDGIDPAAVVEAARQADAHDFIRALPEGYDTFIGDRGTRLSGGQRQRVALARALLRNPDLLVLDEATNALDSASEAAIQETLDRLSGRLTILVIAHRLATVRKADQLVVLSKGRVTEIGRPADLIRASGTFARLYELQLSGLEDREPALATASAQVDPPALKGSGGVSD